ncbi:hypothetical protein [Flavobacterium collinsii]|uniref:Uncharacterized protein n=1 Tax=Flavobacterium collinsii TaxID=1114861 RepID=A0A9W4TGJ8_9FLAO|nr:hypothetical protein [Flavobacterium collinsii]CAI2767592.1 conserved protein of unknown function [Flavobacterium collinsii]
MKKKFTLEIANPCSENFDQMIPNSQGSFCDSCAKNVIDLSRKTNAEVARFVANNKDQNICARLKITQLEEEFAHHEISKINTLKYAAVAASILLASNVTGQEKTPLQTEINESVPKSNVLGKIAISQTVQEEISITIKGKLLDAKTNRPLSGKIYPNLTLSINDSQPAMKIDPKTGDFSITSLVSKNDEALMITISSGDYYLSKTIPFDIKKVKGKILHQNIMINTEELIKVYIARGLGINYREKKVIKGN